MAQGTGIIHRMLLTHSWGDFASLVAQAEADGWRLVGFQIVTDLDQHNIMTGMTVYGVIAKGQA